METLWPEVPPASPEWFEPWGGLEHACSSANSSQIGASKAYASSARAVLTHRWARSIAACNR